ncbi:unnamed protein product, partial [Didymodactylos carnosus]
QQIPYSLNPSQKLLVANSSRTNERASFSLEATLDQERQFSKKLNGNVQQEKDDDDGSSDEIVYSCALSEENETSSNSSMDDNELSDQDDDSLPLDDDDDSVLKSDTSKSNSNGVSHFQPIESTHEESQRKTIFSIDSGHVVSDSPSDLSPCTSPSWKKIPVSNIPSKIILSNRFNSTYFRSPCLKCGSSTYSDDVVSVEKYNFHKHCIICSICGKMLRENEYTLFDKANDGTIQFYCTLDFCKRRLKQVQTNIATNIQNEKEQLHLSESSRLYPKLSYCEKDNADNKNRRNTTTLTTSPSTITSSIPQQSLSTSWSSSFRLYPSLTDALSKKSHPLNFVKLPYTDNNGENNNEHQRSLFNTNIGFEKSEMFAESTAELTQHLAATTLNKTSDSKQRFKRRSRDRPDTPPMLQTVINKTQHSSSNQQSEFDQ